MAVHAIGKPSANRASAKSLGGHLYEIPDLPAKKTRFSVLTLVCMVLLSPLIILRLLAATLCMMFGTKSIREALLQRLIPRLMSSIEEKTSGQRELLLQHVSGKVLDVGCGAGGYFQFLKMASHVVALEPVSSLRTKIQQAATKAGIATYQVTIVHKTIEEYSKNVPDASFDWIILGNVLCEVPNPRHTLTLVHQLLKPGGHVFFSEHQGSPKGTNLRRVQDFVNPWWRRYSGGCNCNRRTLHDIQCMSDWEVISRELEHVPVFGEPMVLGLARKREPTVGLYAK